MLFPQQLLSSDSVHHNAGSCVQRLFTATLGIERGREAGGVCPDGLSRKRLGS